MGAWEAFSSGAGLPRLARYRYPGRWPDDIGTKTLVKLARSGDTDARAVIDEAARMLGRGISYLVDLLSPDVVVLGSLAVRAGDLFLPTAQGIVDTECLPSNLPCPVVAASGKGSGPRLRSVRRYTSGANCQSDRGGRPGLTPCAGVCRTETDNRVCCAV